MAAARKKPARIVFLDQENPLRPSPSEYFKMKKQLEEAKKVVEDTKKILIDGLRYYEHDGRSMSKSIVREALETLGVPRDKQP